MRGGDTQRQHVFHATIAQEMRAQAALPNRRRVQNPLGSSIEYVFFPRRAFRRGAGGTSVRPLAPSAQEFSKRGSALPAWFDFSAPSLIVDQHCCPVIPLTHFGAMATDDQRAAVSPFLSQHSAEFGDPTPRGRARQRRAVSGARSLTPARRKRRLSSRAACAAAARTPPSSSERDDAADIEAFAQMVSPVSDEVCHRIMSCFPAVWRRTLARRFAQDQEIRKDKTFILVKPISSSSPSASRGPHGAGLPGVIAVVPLWFQPANADLASVRAPSPVYDRCFICGLDDGDVDGIGHYLEGCVATVKSFPFPEVTHLRATTPAWAMLAPRLESHGDVFACARCSGVCVAWEDTLNIDFTADLLRPHIRRAAEKQA